MKRFATFNAKVIFLASLLSLFYFIWEFHLVYHSGVEYETSEACKCSRRSFYSSRNRTRINSSCSDEGTFFEAGQNVVSFCLYLPQPIVSNGTVPFVRGILPNILKMRKYYPGFSMRVYTDEKLTPESEYCKMWCENPDLFWCDVRRSPSLGNIQDIFYAVWRFAPLGDPTVDIFLSRDLDSYINMREAVAVKEWLESNKSLHAMRDHPRHRVPFLAGMWGARNTLIKKELAVDLRRQLLNTRNRTNTKYLDQILLAEVFSTRKKDIFSHDSYHCSDLSVAWGTVRPFPTRRRSSVDLVSTWFEDPELHNDPWNPAEICPRECRPSYGKYWATC